MNVRIINWKSAASGWWLIGIIYLLSSIYDLFLPSIDQMEFTYDHLYIFWCHCAYIEINFVTRYCHVIKHMYFCVVVMFSQSIIVSTKDRKDNMPNLIFMVPCFVVWLRINNQQDATLWRNLLFQHSLTAQHVSSGTPLIIRSSVFAASGLHIVIS
jgi:hypothetical protein